VLASTTVNRDVVSVSTSWSPDGLETHQRLVSVSRKNYNGSVLSWEANVSISSRLFVSHAKTLFCPNLQAILLKWAKSAVTIMAVLTRIGNMSMHYLLTKVSGWWSASWLRLQSL